MPDTPNGTDARHRRRSASHTLERRGNTMALGPSIRVDRREAGAQRREIAVERAVGG
ncbi:hypothetical protein [Natronolimnohabitans innermongolicus]|uniref:hypothetical protein n=1 Tax=Natronolimnohabitans innermongolicus TaxID=253107 RepID=UPI0013760738|nr:hypothetical protein [Natronolimnohabitans innermongolicus]